MVRIDQRLYQQMVDHGYTCLPNEACGLISGHDEKVEQIWPLVNDRPSPHRFFVSKTIVSSTLDAIEQSGQQVLAVYHTHPGTAPVPSSYDLQSHQDSTVKMVIISYKFHSPRSACYSILDGRYVKHPFHIGER
ncbi:M67 family metallopeptidase [Halobacillus sp. Cin3]|uniref:M67 family metallopeptidase n=1 Tax=Halobacillus sp. Cin3 TaxID=2928441 RepID=UPI00248E5E9F|nr:M67 family metallopeptidase [Halobacillus sp. Cin3]